jgi:hypothetical protein
MNSVFVLAAFLGAIAFPLVPKTELGNRKKSVLRRSSESIGRAMWLEIEF